MLPIDIYSLERQARQMRAEEMRRLNALLAARTGAAMVKLADWVTTLALLVSNGLRPLFSWNPQGLHLR